MTLSEKAENMIQNGVNDHVKQIGRQIKTWTEGVSVGSMTKQEMRNHLAGSIGGYRDGAIIASVLGVNDAVKSEIEALINEAKTFAAD